MASRTTWLDAGLVVLAELGAPGVRIERLASRLGVTKGSFYHHFAGMGGYKLDLLDHYEQRFTSRYIEVAETDPAVSAEDRLHRLRRAVLTDGDRPELEVAMRAWAAQDDDVHATQQRIDGRRLDYLTDLCAERLGDPAAGLALARVLYLLLVGGHLVVPALPNAEIDRLYDWALARVEVKRP